MALATSSPAPTARRSSLARFLLLPAAGFVAAGRYTSNATQRLLRQLQPCAPGESRTVAGVALRVIASAATDGTKVIALRPDEAALLQAEAPGLRLVPERRYLPARAPRLHAKRRPQARGGEQQTLVLKVTAGEGAQARPLPDCLVVMLTDLATGAGVEGTTNARGELRLRLPAGLAQAPLVAAYPLHGAWPREWRRLPLQPGLTLALPALEPDFADARRTLYGAPQDRAGEGVTVGVIDTGVGPHADLPVALGRNTTLVEPVDQWHDEDGHGTHVAGVIAARARAGEPGVTGEAAGVRLHAYRVFEHGEVGASNAAIREAIRQAVLDGCDIINMSLGGGGPDPAIAEAIQFARLSGAVCVVAAGNEGGPVSFPASDPLSVAVSAIGVHGTWPKGAAQQRHVTTPTGKHDSFVARFSNRGVQVRLAAPGVGIVSTIHRDRYGVMDGTSMASPIAAGVLARALARSPQLLRVPRDARRSEAIIELAMRHAEDLGFPATMQGKGLAR